MEGTIGTPPQTHCRDSGQTIEFLSCGPETGPVTTQDRPYMEAWTPGFHVSLGQSLPSTEACMEAGPWLTHVIGAAHSQPGSYSARNQSWADGLGGQEQ